MPEDPLTNLLNSYYISAIVQTHFHNGMTLGHRFTFTDTSLPQLLHINSIFKVKLYS